LEFVVLYVLEEERKEEDQMKELLDHVHVCVDLHRHDQDVSTDYQVPILVHSDPCPKLVSQLHLQRTVTETTECLSIGVSFEQT
jgi:hypothetical protein